MVKEDMAKVTNSRVAMASETETPQEVDNQDKEWEKNSKGKSRVLIIPSTFNLHSITQTKNTYAHNDVGVFTHPI